MRDSLVRRLTKNGHECVVYEVSPAAVKTIAGHFVKVVHSGIEYGSMAADTEGLNILRNPDARKHSRDTDAETAPLRNPEYYQYDLDLPEISAAIDEPVPVPVLSAALYERFSSHRGAEFRNPVLSVLRKQFGGHHENKKGGS